MFSKGFGQEDVVKHLNHPDTPFVGFRCQETKQFFVAGKIGLTHFQSIGIIGQTHQGGKGMTVPKVEGVHPVFYQHIQVFDPQRLVIEPGEGFLGVGVLV